MFVQNAPTRAGCGADASAVLTLRIINGPTAGQVLTFQNAKVILGSASNATVELRTSGVAPEHVEILRRKDEIVVRRLASDARLNGRLFTEAFLHPGDRLSVGPIDIAVVATGTSPQKDQEAAGAALASDHQAWQAEQEEWLAQQARLEQRTALLEHQLQAQLHEVAQEKQSLVDERTGLEEQKQSLADARASLENERQSLNSDRQALVAETEKSRTAQQDGIDQQVAELKQKLAAVEALLAERASDTSDREALLNNREAELADREQKMATHLAALASREADLAAAASAQATKEELLAAKGRELKQIAARQAQAEQQLEAIARERTILDTRAAQLDREASEIAGREAELVQREQQLAHDAHELDSVQQAFSDQRNHSRQAEATEPPVWQTETPQSDLTPAAENNSATSSDDVFARLRAMSLLKSDAEESAEKNDRESVDIGIPPAPWRVAAVAEEATPGASPNPEPQAAEEPAASVQASEPAAEPQAHHEEQSIDDYMARLLDRVRGVEPGGSPVPSAKPIARQQADVKEPQSSSPAPTRILPARERETPAPTPTRLEPRTTAPEKSANLAAMRALANFSTRAAIAAHHTRHGLNRIWRTVGIGAATLVVGLVLLCLTSDLRSWYVLGAAIAIAASGIWFFRAFHLTRKLRLRRRKAERDALDEPADQAAAPPAASPSAE